MIKLIAPPRTSDPHGSGAWQASRGDRKHTGVDMACWPTSTLLSPTTGTVTKIGRPYYNSEDSSKNHFRYVEITTPLEYRIRYMYVEPCVHVGDEVSVDQPLGVSQDLTKVYDGITPHIHVDIKHDGEYVNPETYFKER